MGNRHAITLAALVLTCLWGLGLAFLHLRGGIAALDPGAPEGGIGDAQEGLGQLKRR